MGYTTYFNGEFDVTPTLSEEHRTYLDKFAGTRRVRRHADHTALRPDPIREAVGLPIGEEAEYFVGEGGYRGQGQDDPPYILDNNRPPASQPELWCQWIPAEDGKSILWDGGEKFYEFQEWIQYLVHHFLAKWGYTLNGTVYWEGEEWSDQGRIVITDNEIDIQVATVTVEYQ